MAEHADGWYYGYAPTTNEDGKEVDSRNVIGRFRDHQRLNGAKSRAARKSVYDLVPLLEASPLMNAQGFESKERDSTVIRFDEAYVNASVAAIERFKEAWIAYQLIRKAEVTDEEREALKFIAPSAAPKPKKQPKEKAPPPPANVVTLQQAG